MATPKAAVLFSVLRTYKYINIKIHINTFVYANEVQSHAPIT